MKKRKVKMKNKIKIAIYSFILLVSISVYTILNSSIFELKEIILKGNQVLSKNDIINSASIELNKNLFQYKLNKLEKSINDNSYVKEVNINRKFPNKLEINIKENSEDAIIIYKDKYIYIQKDGLILSEKKEITTNNIPLIQNLNVEEYSIGDSIKIKDEKKQKRILYLLECIDSNNMKREIDNIILEKQFISMNNSKGLEILLKLDENIDYNINRLKQILIDLKTKGIKKGTIDLRNKDQAVYSPV